MSDLATDRPDGSGSAGRSGRRMATLVMLGVCLLWLSWLGHLALHRWHGLGFGAFDIGIFDQGLWLLSVGEEPFVTLRGLHLFADHASYLMFLLVPVYWVWPDARALILITTLIPAVAGWLSFRIALVEGLRPWHGVVVAASVLVMPAMVWTPWDAFHPETVAIALLPASYLAARRGRFLLAVVLAGLILLAKEDAALVIVPYAVYLWWRWRESRRHAVALVGLAVAIQALSLLVVLPGLSPTGELIYTGRYTWDLGELATWSRVLYLPSMLLPAALAFWVPRLLLVGLPITVANLVSIHGYQHEIRWHYSAYLVGVLAIAVPLGASRLARRLEDPSHRREGPPGGVTTVLSLALVASLVGLAWVGPQLVTRYGLWSGLIEPERVEFEQMLAAVPDHAAVSATWTIAPHLAHRPAIYMAPNPFSPRFWGVDGVHPPPPDPSIIDYLAIDTRQEIEEIDVVVDRVLAEGWTVVVDGTFTLIRRP
jgi:uncharacterized membrane protein